jgi:hypothetical protein
MPYPYTSIAGWSHSRFHTISECKRRYFYQYYPKFLPATLSKKAIFLRQLSNQKMAVGSLLHEIIEQILKRYTKDHSTELNGKKLSDAIRSKALKMVRAQPFFETYYLGHIVQAEEILKPVETFVNMFLESDIHGILREEAGNRNNSWVIEPGDFGEIRIRGLKAYCKVDVMYKNNSDCTIIDWKSGRESSAHREQLLAYVEYAINSFKIPAEDIRCLMVYFGEELRTVEYRFTQNEVDEFEARVVQQTGVMHSFCSDPGKNIPLPLELFGLTEDLTQCINCKFKELCNR